MKAPRTLRTRIVFYFCGYLAVLLILYSGALVAIFRSAEDKAFNRQLSEISNKMVQYAEKHNEVPRYLPLHVSAYIGLENVPPTLQSHVKNSKPNVFEFNEDGLGYHVAIVPIQSLGQILYIFYDVTSIKATEQFESYMSFALFAIGLGVLVVGWLLARALSNRILNPLSVLAKTVQSLSLDEGSDGLHTVITADEVGVLAQTIDQLLNRISEFARREREFTSHVSHELRTPVTIIKGAIEIIIQKSDKADTKLSQLLKRIQRAVADIEMLIDTFLLLARKRQLPDKNRTCSISAVIETVVATYRYLLAGKPVNVNIRTVNSGILQIPPSLVTIALGNLVRNAFQYTMQGEVEILAFADRVRVTDSGPGFDGTKQVGGLGLTIVKRLCERMNWQFYITSKPDDGTQAELIFSQNGHRGGQQLGTSVEKIEVHS